MAYSASGSHNTSTGIAPKVEGSSGEKLSTGIRMETLADGDASVTRLIYGEYPEHSHSHLGFTGTQIHTTGAAQRYPDDKPDPEIGLLLSQARALRKLADRLERKATGKMKFNENKRNASNNRE